MPNKLSALAVQFCDQMAEDDALCLFIHELVEARLCQKSGVTAEQVRAWDAANGGDPSKVSGAPYREQHARALEIERHVADILGVAWPDYEDRLRAISKR